MTYHYWTNAESLPTDPKEHIVNQMHLQLSFVKCWPFFQKFCDSHIYVCVISSASFDMVIFLELRQHYTH